MTVTTLPTGTGVFRSTRTGVAHAMTTPDLAALCGKDVAGQLQPLGEDAGRVTCRFCRAKLAQKPAKVAFLHQDEDGTLTALSSNGRDVYQLRNDAAGNWTCTCPAGMNGRRCYHIAAAVERFTGFFARPAAPKLRATADLLYA